MAVTIETAPVFIPGKPRLLFEGKYAHQPTSQAYDIHPDGTRFLMIKLEEETAINQVHVVLNLFEELKRIAPTGK